MDILFDLCYGFVNQVDELLQEVRNSTVYQNPHEPSQAALLSFENSWKSFKGLDASHWEKRAKVSQLTCWLHTYLIHFRDPRTWHKGPAILLC